MLVKKVSLKLLSSNVTSVDVTRAKARGTFTLAVRCESNANIGRIESLPKLENWRQLTEGHDAPIGKELSSFELLGGSGTQGLVPYLVNKATNS